MYEDASTDCAHHNTHHTTAHRAVQHTHTGQAASPLFSPLRTARCEGSMFEGRIPEVCM